MATYLSDLIHGRLEPGEYLAKAIEGFVLSSLSVDDFLELLVNTKRPQIFAESDVFGNGKDWNQIELSLLGGLSVIVPVSVFDDGGHSNPVVHDELFSATLLFSARALLRNGQGAMLADWAEVHQNEVFSLEGFIELYRRRLLPVLKWVNAENVGMGCGQFAGKYQGQLGVNFEFALKQILREHAAELPKIKSVWYDPYSECEARDEDIEHIKFLTRPLLADLFPRPQLSELQFFGFEGCYLYSFVAWDHVSWPGNDFYVGSRATDDGVKAAATDTMRAITGMQGKYIASVNKYLPPGDYPDWIDLVYGNSISLEVKDALFVA